MAITQTRPPTEEKPSDDLRSQSEVENPNGILDSEKQTESDSFSQNPPKVSSASFADPKTRTRSRTMRCVAAATLVFTGWHLFASFLWIAPVTPLRELVPGNMLHSYMIPMFGQSWSVFAPAPINGDFSLKVRAQIEQNGELIVTDWVDAAQAEVHGMHTHNLFPPRASTAGVQQASALKTAWDKLAQEQQSLVAQDFAQDDTSRERLDFLLREDDPEAVGDGYVVIEQRTAAYATQVARAVWGSEIRKIQFQASRQNVIPFAQRHDPEAVRPPVQIVQTGWRSTVDFPGQSDARFAETFTPLYNSYEESIK